MYTHGFTLMLALAVAQPAHSSMILASENFTTYTGVGLAPGGGNGMLDSDLWSVTGASDGPSAFGATRSQGDLARGRSPGGERGGGLYAFALPGGLSAVGVQPTSSDFTPGALTYRFINDSGADLSQLEASFDFWILNDGARSTRMTVDASVGGSDWLALPALTLDSPRAADTQGWQPWAVSASLPAVELLAGDALQLRWSFDDLAGSGGRDEVALSRLQLSGAPVSPVQVLPAPATAVLALAGLVCVRRRARRSLTGINAMARLR
jgi:hypothetical protein